MSNARQPFREQTFYHLSNKSFDGDDIYKDKEDYEIFTKYMIQSLLEFPSIIVTSYCFLPNHFHLVIKNGKRGYAVSEWMRKIQISYAMYYKKKYANTVSTKGIPVFAGRFRAYEIQDQEDLKQTESFVNFNAIYHKITTNISDWPYTSLHQIIDTGHNIHQETHIKTLGASRSILDYMDYVLKYLEP